MSTSRELNYMLYVQKMDGFTRQPFHDEIEKYIAVQTGDVDTVKQNFERIRENFTKGKGKLSDNPVRNLRYHLIVAVAVIARICVAGGLEHNEAYALGDIYIRKADVCDDYNELLNIFEEMQIDYAKHMREVKKYNVISLHVRKCIDYIYEHLHEGLTVKVLAEVVGLNQTYLSKLFAKETGMTMKKFITKARVNTAENLLKYSDYPYSEISFSLGFSSQSAFISVFKKETGMTPRQYRDKYYS